MTVSVGVIMGSDSDWPVMKAAAEALDEFGVTHEVRVISAHRTPQGMLASVTPLPVIGVPVPLKYLDGMDSLMSIVQMPAGIPVATVSIAGARNAGLLAVRILAASDAQLQAKVVSFQEALTAMVAEKDAKLHTLL